MAQTLNQDHFLPSGTAKAATASIKPPYIGEGPPNLMDSVIKENVI